MRKLYYYIMATLPIWDLYLAYVPAVTEWLLG